MCQSWSTKEAEVLEELLETFTPQQLALYEKLLEILHLGNRDLRSVFDVFARRSVEGGYGVYIPPETDVL